MSVVVGDETGLLKLVSLSSGNVVSTVGDQGRDLAVKGLCWTSNGGDFVSIRENGMLETWNASTGVIAAMHSQQSGIVNPVSCRRIQGSSPNFEDPTIIVCYDAIGNISIEKLNNQGIKSSIAEFEITGPIAACTTCLNGGALFGGRENDVQMYDVNTQQSVWKAKNVPHDKLSLRVPVWITALSLLSKTSDVNGANIVTGTGHRHIRIYDTKASRQPIVSFEMGDEYRVTAIQPTEDGQQLYVGDTAGEMNLWDLRMQRRIYTLKGSTGSIRDIQTDASGTHVAAVGLDRYLRVYSGETHKSEKNVYLKNRLNVCLVGGSLNGTEKNSSSSSSGGKKRTAVAVAGGASAGRATKAAAAAAVVVNNEKDDDLLEVYADSDDEQEEEEEDDESDDDDDDDDEEDEEGDSSDAEDDDDDEESGSEAEDSEEDHSEEEEDDDEEEEEVPPPKRGAAASAAAGVKRSLSAPAVSKNAPPKISGSSSSDSSKKRRK